MKRQQSIRVTLNRMPLWFDMTIKRLSRLGVNPRPFRRQGRGIEAAENEARPIKSLQ